MLCARSEVSISRGSLTVVTLSNTAPTQATLVSEGKILISTSPEKVRYPRDKRPIGFTEKDIMHCDYKATLALLF